MVNGANRGPQPLLDQTLISHTKFGYSERLFRFTFGKNSNVDNVQADLWEGPTPSYVPPAVGTAMKIVSTSANDTAAGTGVQKVRISWLNDQYELQTVEEVSLNGLTAVNLTGSKFRIQYLHTSQAGTWGKAAGDIKIVDQATGLIVYAIIKAGFNTARQAFGTVPAGYTAYLSHWQASSGSASGSHFTQMTLYATSLAGNRYPGIFLIQDETGTLNNGQTINFPIPIMVPEKSDIKISAVADSGGAAVTALGAIMWWFELNNPPPV